MGARAVLNEIVKKSREVFLMKKRSGKSKGFPRKLLALLLCCVCLVSAAPIAASDLETGYSQTTEGSALVEGSSAENQSDDALVEDNETQGNDAVTLSLYDKIMAAETCSAMFEMISDDANYDEASSLTAEQVNAIKACAEAMEDDGYKEPLVQTLNALLEYLGEGTSSEYDTQLTGDIDPRYYRRDVPVYYDTVTELSQSARSTGGANVANITLGGIYKGITRGNSEQTSWSGGQSLGTYFQGASPNNMKNATLSITAAPGYYVTGVVVSCAPSVHGQTLTPFRCSTWSDGNEFIRTFNLADSVYDESVQGGIYRLSFDINSRYFSHNGATAPAAYFIMIQVAKVPTPLYVEYDYGNVTDFLTIDSNSAFYNPTWTVKNDSNNYGTGSVYTNDTQFAYAYDQDISVMQQWSHKANTISDAALAEAAAQGYVFDGWAATYYNDCSVKNVKDSHNNNYTMTFKDTYLTGSYNPGDKVQLPTNVRLVAKWKYEPPKTYKLTVKKTLSGNAYDPDAKFNFTVNSESFDLGNNEEKTFDITIGSTVSVTENDTKGYTYTLKSVTPDTLEYTETTNGVSFTMPSSNVTVEINNAKEITIDTGINLDVMPYVIILALVAVGVVMVIKNRRRHDDF